MSKSTTKNRIAQDEAYEALADLEVWAHDTLNGKIEENAEQGARIAKELVEKVKKWKRHRL